MSLEVALAVAIFMSFFLVWALIPSRLKKG